ncbi:unnamed protein product [Caretta caretta]
MACEDVLRKASPAGARLGLSLAALRGARRPELRWSGPPVASCASGPLSPQIGQRISVEAFAPQVATAVVSVAPKGEGCVTLTLNNGETQEKP